MNTCQIYTLDAKVLWLGRFDEHGVRPIGIDVAPWLSAWGAEGTFMIMHWRPGEDNPYNPEHVELDGTTLIWTPDEVDLAKSGRGTVELHYYIGGDLVKSRSFQSIIERTRSEGAAPTSATDNWVARMEQAAVTAQDAAEDAEDAAETATEGAQAVAQALPTVTQAAQTATSAATTATNAATEAATSEEVASVAATAAQSASETATAASQTAVSAASTATTKAAQAVEAAGTATTKASEATQAATTATANAQTSTVKAGEDTTAAATATAKATEATTAVSTASAAATTATSAASTATNAASTATAAKTAAETAQTAAETAQAAAEQAAEEISESAAQIATNTSDISELKADLSDLPDNGVVANAKQLLSENGTDNTEPYTFRAVPVNADRAKLDAVVGGTVVWNQLIRNAEHTDTINGVTLTADNSGLITLSGTSTKESGYINLYVPGKGANLLDGHAYLINVVPKVDTGTTNMSAVVVLFGNGGSLFCSNKNGAVVKQSGAPTGSSSFYVRPSYTFNGTFAFYCSVIDLTQMFGSTIADYIYDIETATPGAGVAWFHKYYPADYYPFDAGTLKSVEGVSEKVTRDADNNVLGTYPLDSSLTLRGIPKLTDG